MHVDKTGIFRAALNVITEGIADVFNRHAIPRLFELNAWKLDELPRIVPNNVDPPNLTELTSFMSGMAALGMQFFPDPDLEKFLRDVAHLPEIPEDLLEQRRQMAMMQNASTFMESQMQAQGMEQKQMAVQEGFTPEQAEMQAQTPRDDQAAQQQAQGMDPNAQAKSEQEMAMAQQGHQFDMKSKEMDLKGKEKEQAFKDRDMQREGKAKDADLQRDAKSKETESKFKDRDLRRQEALANLKARTATSQYKAKAKADMERSRDTKKPKGHR